MDNSAAWCHPDQSTRLERSTLGQIRQRKSNDGCNSASLLLCPTGGLGTRTTQSIAELKTSSSEVSVPLSPPQSYASFQCRSLFRSIRFVDRGVGHTVVLQRTVLNSASSSILSLLSPTSSAAWSTPDCGSLHGVVRVSFSPLQPWLNSAMHGLGVENSIRTWMAGYAG
ncbi:hypothetical protein ASPVEDRAFT_676484 [Aspergillus versicolor CBS 583.65]|uniref:Uncharacterized protein n=1 Tax=Aspergillus versicolor CBS 583.65 TaxID=1036611 RepID=A0A1L9PLP4_ASPVE|nr:uncharacterized protein ASPVEDRAFT_676484 [Aspergillus versicolor CBS 583.65]OJJ02438.1 hypothetical protein ASPVEDRAFT_676484 [Aspergillus versicolor CBS 583.65]